MLNGVQVRLTRLRVSILSGAKKYFLKVTKPAVGSTQSSIQWILATLSTLIKHPKSEADHSLASSARLSNVWCCIYKSCIGTALLVQLLLG